MKICIIQKITSFFVIYFSFVNKIYSTNVTKCVRITYVMHVLLSYVDYISVASVRNEYNFL